MYSRDYDVDYVVMRFRLPAGPERERVLDCIRLFGEEVLPTFHGQRGIGSSLAIRHSGLLAS